MQFEIKGEFAGRGGNAQHSVKGSPRRGSGHPQKNARQQHSRFGPKRGLPHTLEAIRIGVSGYLLKDASIASIREALIEVHEGGRVIDPQLSQIVLKALSGDPILEKDQLLSRREQQVLELMAMGYLKKEVAERMEVSYSAVAQYTESIYKKFRSPT